ncbi:helix-turn-helix domain-containing protein [Rhodoluna lacicola]|uniref:Putative transcriptional regulator with C-terminal CBS domains n=1 Tax=Rhodoluna lacicola TaxID=529884 RepID=A0A060JNM6_9MICO|nr:helix-turn-helix transcriptional regulator [Rhodoluna lacicola]AIC48168.1 putative transcriptional regulator with C-terminal CBS domains [Rhodoluna lacicola]BDS51085.1 hypothetical protein RKACHI23_13470 [Rhodoluna lacicola]
MAEKLGFEEIGVRIRAKSTPEQVRASQEFIDEALRVIDLALAVRDARIAANLTQSQLAEITGITQAEISRIEGAKYAPRVGTLFKLAAALNTSFLIGNTAAPIRVPALAG